MRKNKKSKEELEILENEEENAVYEDTIIEEVFENPKDAKKAKKEQAKKEKAKKHSKKKDKGDFVEEDDLYYGIQIKPFEELRKGYDIEEADLKEDTMEDTYAKLFDDTVTSLDEEIEESFRRIQKERRKRVAMAVESAGVDVDKVVDELGIIAPMPVTAKREEEKAAIENLENTAEFTKALSETAKSNTMEIKLNVINNALELQDTKLEVMDSESIEDINKKVIELKEIEETKEEVSLQEPAEEAEETEKEAEAIEISFPELSDVTRYREKIIPTHLLNIDVMQSALVSEAQIYEIKNNKEEKKPSPFTRFAYEEEIDVQSETDEEIDDYVSAADAKPIFADMNATLKKLSMRSGICIAALIVLLIASGTLTSNKNEASFIAYLIVNLIIVGALIAVNFRSLKEGFKNLLNFKANSDSAVAAASVAVLVQIIAGFFNTRLISDNGVSIYGGALAFILLLNAIGKSVMVRRIHGNFRFVTSREQKYAVRGFTDHNTALKLSGGTSVEPKIAYQQKAGFLKRFLQLSYKSDPSEKASEVIAPIGLVLSLIFAIIALIVSKSMMAGINTLAASLLISVPASNLLAVNLPVSRFCRKLNRAGAMVANFEGIKALSEMNSVMVDSHDLFPLGTVTLEGVKTLGTRDSEQDVYLAGALAYSVGGIMADIFHQVNDEADYGEADSFKIVPECGFEGMVSGKKVLIGNRGILVNNGITPPEKEEVVKYTESTNKLAKKVLFVAVENELSCMLILGYKADPRRRKEIKALERNGIALLINQGDPNVTKKLIGTLFGVNESYVSVINGTLSQTFENTVKAEVTRADATAATKGRVESLMKAVSASNELKPVLSTIVACEVIAVIIGLLIALLFTIFSPIKQLSTLSIIIFNIFWLVLIMVIPKIKLKIK